MLPRNGPSRAWFAILSLQAWLVVGLGDSARAQVGAVVSAAPPPTIRIGFGGFYKVGRWTPIDVELPGPAAAGTTVVVIAPDPDGNPVEHLLNLNADGAAYSGLFQSGQLDAGLRVEVRRPNAPAEEFALSRDEDSPVALRPQRQGTEFWGALSALPGFEQAAQQWSAELRKNLDGGEAPAAIALPLEWSSLPAEASGWESLDVLVIGPGQFGPDDPRDEALRQWLSSGGRLVLSLGGAAEEFSKSRLGSWLPVPIESVVALRQLDSIVSYIPGSSALRLPVGKNEITAARFPGSGSGALAGPVALRRSFGFGSVTAFALNLDERPLSDWESLPDLCRKLTNSYESPLRKSSSGSEFAASGMTDLSTQLLSSLDHFEEVRRPSFKSLLLWMIAWMAIVGPLDYLLVHRLFQRPQWTWVSLPLLVVVGSWMSMRSAQAANGARLAANQVDLLDIDGPHGLMHGRSWMTFYSPETARYSVSAGTPVAPGALASMTWNGKCEEGFRGMYRGGGLDFGAPAYALEPDQLGIRGMPLRIWASGAVSTQWRARAEAPLFDSELHVQHGDRLGGRIIHHFEEPLLDWAVLYRNFVYYPRRDRRTLEAAAWAPGEAWNPESGGQTIARTFLTGQREVLVKLSKRDEVLVQSEAYDALERNPLRLLRTLSYHEAMGGSAYTGLTNEAFGRLDLTRLLDLDQAVLFARVRSPATSYHINNKPLAPEEHTTIVRAVLPVSAGGEPPPSSTAAP